MFKFDEKEHKYYFDGVQVPGVTDTINECSPFFQTEAAEKAAHFGSVVHKTLELWEKGELESYDKEIGPWVWGWKRFIKEYLPKQKGIIFADIKTGQYSPKWHLQTAAYSKLVDVKTAKFPIIEEKFYSQKYHYAGTMDRVYKCSNDSRKKIVCVQLRGDSDFKIFPSRNTIETDFNVFLSMCNVWRWKKEYNQK